MAVQAQTSIPIPAPGYYGLNTQDSPVGMSTSFASVADHCVIDGFGRIGSRAGLQAFTQNPATTLNQYPAERAFEFIDILGRSWFFVCGGGNIYLQSLVNGNLTALTSSVLPKAATKNNWQMVSLDDRCYFIQEGQHILVFEPAISTTVLIEMDYTLGSPSLWPSAATGEPSCGTTGFGRLFVGDFDNNKSLILVSDLTVGAPLEWEQTIDVSQFWPNGTDEIVALKVHNDFLIVFGKRSILVYGVSSGDTYTISLIDTVGGIGCIARDSLAVIGTDIVFLDASGLRSFLRTVQEKSMPIGDLSLNIKDDITTAISQTAATTITCVYIPEKSLYTLIFPALGFTYVFETKNILENGAYKATLWNNRRLTCGLRTILGKTYYGAMGGMYQYTKHNDTSFVDNGTPFSVDPIVGNITYTASRSTTGVPFRYWTQPQSFQQPSKTKFLKQVDVTVSGGEGVVLWLAWVFNYDDTRSVIRASQEGTNLFYYNLNAEFNAQNNPVATAEYSGQDDFPSSRQLNVWGSGRVVSIGFEATINESHFSIQEINIQALLGRII
jgi:hypothetical protein